MGRIKCYRMHTLSHVDQLTCKRFHWFARQDLKLRCLLHPATFYVRNSWDGAAVAHCIHRQVVLFISMSQQNCGRRPDAHWGGTFTFPHTLGMEPVLQWEQRFFTSLSLACSAGHLDHRGIHSMVYGQRDITWNSSVPCRPSLSPCFQA